MRPEPFSAALLRSLTSSPGRFAAACLFAERADPAEAPAAAEFTEPDETAASGEADEAACLLLALPAVAEPSCPWVGSVAHKEALQIIVAAVKKDCRAPAFMR